MNLEELKAAVTYLALQLKPYAAKEKAGTLTDEESVKYDEILADFNAKAEQLTKATERQQAAAAAEAIASGNTDTLVRGLDSLVAAGAGRETGVAAGAGGAAGIDSRSIGRRFVESDGYKKALAEDDWKMAKADRFQLKDESLLIEQRALIYSGTPSASTLLPQVLPTIYRGTERVSAVRQVLQSMRTNSNAVTVLRENVFTNAAAEVAEATTVAGGAKPESAITFTEETFAVRTVAHWIPITRQMLQDLPFMESYVDGRLRDGLERRVSDQLINGNGTAPNISGLLDQSGLTVADNTYFSGAPVRDAGTDNEQPNRIRRAKRLVRTSGLARASFVMANPADVETWDTLTTADGVYLFGGPLTAGDTGRMWGLPVYEDEYIAAGTAIVGDGTAAAVVDRMDAEVYTADQHSDFFVRNIFVLLAELRLTLAVFRPAAFVVVTLY